MILNTAIFTATIEAARIAAANRPDVLRAIDRAVIEIQKASYWSFADGVLTIKSTTSGELYRVNGAHTCPARTKHCKHNIARLLMIRYTERLAAAAPVAAEAVADTDRAELVADVEKAWHKARPFAGICEPLRQIFGVSTLAALNVEQLQQVYGAITRHTAPVR